MIQTSRAFSVAKPICIIFIALFCIILSSCGRHPAEVLPEPVIARGTWHDHIYVNEFMGFQFELPKTWHMFTDEEIVVVLDRTSAHLNDIWGIPLHFDDIQTGVQDMRAEAFFSGNNVTISYQMLTNDNIGVSEHDYLQMLIPAITSLDEENRNFQIGLYPRRIGDVSWYYMTFDAMEDSVQAYFISHLNGFNRMITIWAYTGGLQAVEEIWRMFAEIEPRFEGKDGEIPTNNNAPFAAYRGTWDNFTYVNPSLGVRFTVPAYYEVYGDDNLAMLMNVPVTFLDGEVISAELWNGVIRNENTVCIMRVYGLQGDIYASVSLFVRSMPRGIRDFSVPQYLQHRLDAERQLWNEMGVNAQKVIAPAVVVVAGHEWHQGRLKIDASHFEFQRDMFIAVADNFIWRIEIDSHNEYELQEILAMFSQY